MYLSLSFSLSLSLSLPVMLLSFHPIYILPIFGCFQANMVAMEKKYQRKLSEMKEVYT